jgi:hypothetical protein
MASLPPNSRTNLDKAIQRLAGTPARFVEMRSLLAGAIVGQFLPEGVAKGGGALRLRFGSADTRATHDLDVARRGPLDAFAGALADGLREGWNGFTGVVVPGRPARPRDVPGEYVMQPFSVKLAYRGQPWCTVALEVGHNEIGDADKPDCTLSPEVAGWFEALGFPAPAPVPLMPLEYQVAQKLHAATAPGSQRAHDLVDLQLIADRVSLDMGRPPCHLPPPVRLPPDAAVAAPRRTATGLGGPVRLPRCRTGRPSGCRRSRRLGERLDYPHRQRAAEGAPGATMTILPHSSSLPRGRGGAKIFSNRWKTAEKFFQSLEKSGRIFQPLENFFPIIGKNARSFPTIGKKVSNHWKIIPPPVCRRKGHLR